MYVLLVNIYDMTIYQMHRKDTIHASTIERGRKVDEVQDKKFLVVPDVRT